MHGSPENFVYCYTAKYDGDRAVYILSGGANKTSYNTLSDGTNTNYRDWSMYKDQSQLDLIEEVHCMTKVDADIAAKTNILRTNGAYWLATPYANNYNCVYSVIATGSYTTWYTHCIGVRPVVTMKEGVYIASGTGTDADPYVLAKEPTE